MRTIKFRAWDNDNKGWCDDFCIELSTGSLLCDHGRTMYVQKIILMQFTGLKDKNGKEIYEGDILQPSGTRAKKARVLVEWEIGADDVYEWAGYPFGDSTKSYYKVIGNIYENPKLIFGKETEDAISGQNDKEGIS